MIVCESHVKNPTQDVDLKPGSRLSSSWQQRGFLFGVKTHVETMRSGFSGKKKHRKSEFKSFK